MPRLQLLYDLRRAPFSPIDNRAMYREILDQCAWADRIGFDTVVLGEHHGTDDGYLPAATTAAAAIAGRTSGLELRPMVMAPFYDPLHLAEELAVVDLVSGGRLTPVVLAGYVRSEFAMFGVDRKDRVDALVECVETLKQAWTGEPFECRGRTVRVTPTPYKQPRPTIVVGGTSDAGARRAAHIGDEFQPGRPGLWRAYVEECQRIGRDPGRREQSGPASFCYVTDDPERAWQEVAPYVLNHLHQRHDRDVDRLNVDGIGTKPNDHGDSEVSPSAETVDDLRRNPSYQVVTPAECVTLAERWGSQGALMFQPMMGGLPPELAWSSLELFERAVLPRLELTRRVAPATYR
jgi:alkanesulfonate monooxygenase SsuD/methylene tetrahydromethanopterin reductase-like flavin-dependent oxidoreductase (luciferase family)